MNGRLVGLLAAALALALLAPSTAQAAHPCETLWTGASGSWNDASKWSAGVPDATKVACITAAGTYTVSIENAGTFVEQLRLGGASGTQTIAVSASAANAATLHVGFDTESSTVDANGVIQLSGAGITTIDGSNSNNPLLNSGTIRVEAGAGDARISAAIDNQSSGTMLFNGGAAINTGRPFINRGSLTVAANQTLTADATGSGPNVQQAGGTWTNNGTTRVRVGDMTHTAGNTAGNPIEICGARLNPSGTGTGTYLVRQGGPGACGATNLTGAVGTGITVFLRNFGENTNDVGIPNPFIINGTVVMDGNGGGPVDDDRVLLVGNPVTIATTGTLRTEGVGLRIIQGALTNNGTLRLNRRDIYLDSSYTQSGTGTLEVDVYSTDPNAPKSQVSTANGNVSVAGTLRVNTTITPSGTHEVVRTTNGTRSGTFSTTQFNGPSWNVVYQPKTVELTPQSGGGGGGGGGGGTPATSFDLRGTWTLDTGFARSTETITEMDLNTGNYSGRGGANNFTWPTQGTATGNNVRFTTGPYDQLQSYTATFEGIISADGNTITGTWTDTNGQRGNFTQTRGTAPPPPPPRGTTFDLRGTWNVTTASGWVENWTSMNLQTGEFSGRGGGGGRSWPTSGTATGNQVTFVTGPYDQLRTYRATFTGTIGADGNSMSGTWTDTGGRSGNWTAVRVRAATTFVPPNPADWSGRWTLEQEGSLSAIVPVILNRSYLELNMSISATRADLIGQGRNANIVRGGFNFAGTVNGTGIDFELSNFGFNSSYRAFYTGTRVDDRTIRGTWTDGRESGGFTMTRGGFSAGAFENPPPFSIDRSIGKLVISPAISCNLTATTGSVTVVARTATAAARRNRKRRRVKGVRVAKFGPVFVPAGEKVVVPVRPVRVQRRRGRARRAVAAQAPRRGTAFVRITCRPSRAPGSSTPPPGASSRPVSSTAQVPVRLPTTVQNPAPGERPYAGIWTGNALQPNTSNVVPIERIYLDVSADGVVRTAFAKFDDECAALPNFLLPFGIATGTGSVEVVRLPIRKVTSDDYPAEAIYRNRSFSTEYGQVTLAINFDNQSYASAFVQAYTPLFAPGFACFTHGESYVLRFRDRGAPPTFSPADREYPVAPENSR